ncbi:MAG: serine/threonine protein kinase [Planctomycetes bacterium]|nr:serine/threonine protein kinase [Planctomycetota bacterium]
MQTIGPYTIQDELGRGGMGVVYRALGSDGKAVALKLLLPERGLSPHARRRFEQELEALTRLRHPGIVPFLASGQHEGAPWVALEFVEGETLTERLRRGPPTVQEVIRIGEQLAAALEHVHAAGLLHRDLKPDNVLLRGGQALLTDFGLALDTTSDRTRLTQTGVHVGTPGFWAPEQGRGDPRAHGTWTDVYGLGAVLYACLTGFPPVRGKTLQECMASGLFERIPSPQAERSAIPEWLSAVVMRCLSYAPSDRPSVAQVARSLAQARDLSAPTTPLTRVAAALAVLTVLSVVAALSLLWRQQGRALEPPAPGVGADLGAKADAGSPDPTLPLCFSLRGRPSDALDGSLALFEPWCFTPGERGLELLAQRPSRAELLVPLVSDGGPWELRASFARVRLTTAGYLTACLASFPNGEAPGGAEIPWRAVGWLLDLDADGQLGVRAVTDVHDASEGRLAFDLDPRSPLSFALRWSAPTLRLVVSTPEGVVATHAQTLAPDAVPRGAVALRLGQVETNASPSLGDAFGDWSHGRAGFTLSELSVRGEGLRLDPQRLQQPRYQEGQLGWWYASGEDPEGLRAAIEALKRVSLERPHAARFLPYLLAWLSAREGDGREAGRQLRGVLALTQGYYPEPKRWSDTYHWLRNRILADYPLYPALIRAELPALIPELRPVRDALAVALDPPQEVDPTRFASRDQARVWAWVELAVRVTAKPLPDAFDPNVLRALYEAGLHQEAEAALRGAPPPASSREALWRGWLAFHQQRYQDALELWAQVDSTYPALERSKACARRWAEPR